MIGGRAEMKKLVEILTPEEKAEHIDGGLDPAKAINEESADLTRKVRSFIENKVFIKLESVERWSRQEEAARSRMIGEIKWRVTCVHQASETAVQGVMKFSLGYGMTMAAQLVEGRSSYVIS